MASFYRKLPRVSAAIDSTNVTITGPITVSNEVEVKNDTGNPIPVSGTNFDIRDLNFGQDSVNISGSSVKVNNGPLKIDYYNINSLSSNSLTVLGSKLISTNSKLRQIDVSGNNIAEYQVELNSSVIMKKRTYFGGQLNAEFRLDNGLSLVAGDVLTVKVIHYRSELGSFDCTLQYTED